MWRRYFILKFLRRRLATAANLDEQTHIWPCTFPNWKCWKDELLDAKPRVVCEHQQDEQTLYTDASAAGFGAVLMSSSGTYIKAGKWTPRQSKLHINEKEALAVQEGLSMLDRHQRPTRIFIDNTSVLYALQKARSKNFLMNIILGQAAQNHGHLITSIEYVESKNNMADYWSRIFSATAHTNHPAPTASTSSLDGKAKERTKEE